MPRTMEIHRLGSVQVDYVSEVATEEELLEFANKIREAGGANVIDALMPSNVNHPNACLIANALNFSCSVKGFHEDARMDNQREDGSYIWGMFFPENMSRERIDAVAAAVDCEVKTSCYGEVAMILPKHIGNAAAAFDSGDAFREYRMGFDA